MITQIKRVYNWKPDKFDDRDFKYSVTAPVKLPTKTDLESQCPPVYDQLSLGSCTGNAIAAALDFDRHTQKEAFINPSRLFIYYNERLMEGSINEDAGAQIRDGIKSVAAQGACPESVWPYDITKFEVKPSADAYIQAEKYQALTYQRLDNTNLNSLKGVLAGGHPFVLGITLYESFESDTVARTGIVHMPLAHEKQIGGHAILCVGYDDSTQMFKIRNSWGTGWGKNGYFFIPYAYMMKLASDLWVITKVE